VLGAGALILIGGATFHLGDFVQGFGGFIALMGAAGAAGVRFDGRLKLPGADMRAKVRADAVGFDEIAEARENEGLPSPPQAALPAPQAPGTLPTASSGVDSSPGPE
jgi:hypothetical protein